MDLAIIYDSLTGNTKFLAEEIKKQIPRCFIEKVSNTTNINADIYFIGTPIIKGMCTEKIEKYFQTLENKKIFLFATAGYGGDLTYFNVIKNRIEKIIPKSNEIIGTFFCQGKMQESVKKRYLDLIKEHPDDKDLKVNLENFEEAKIHPNDNDIKNLMLEIKKINLK